MRSVKQSVSSFTKLLAEHYNPRSGRRYRTVPASIFGDYDTMNDQTAKTEILTSSVSDVRHTFVGDLLALTKFRLSATVVLSAALAYLIAAPAVLWGDLLAVIAGGFATTMAANVLNQVIERDHDQLMIRTENRPLATGRMSVSRAVLIAGLLSVAGTLALGTLHPLAALLGMIALLSYAFIYTPLKRITVAAVFIGTDSWCHSCTNWYDRGRGSPYVLRLVSICHTGLVANSTLLGHRLARV